jgi:tripartite-type tricarboxylate transporter receptor subunit TctC
MKLMRSKTMWSVAAALASTLAIQPALAQDPAANFPTKPISFVMPFAAGGATDLENRPYADEASRMLGKPVVLDFKPGNPGRIGYAYVAKAAPDGYPILSASNTLALVMTLDRDLPYDPMKSLQPVTLMTKWTTIMLSSPKFAANNAREMIAYARANPPGKLLWADSAANGSGHLQGLWITGLLGITATHVHYKGNSQSMIDMAAGRVDITTTRMLPAMPDIKSGARKALAVLSLERSPLLPDVPTLAESDPALKGYEGNSWVGIMTTGGVPPTILKKLNDTFVRIAKSPANVKLKISEGGTAVGSTPEDMRKAIASEAEDWAKLVRKFNIKAEE